MAAKIDRVEREFILKSATEAKAPFKFRAAGRTRTAILSGFDSENLRFQSPSTEGPMLMAGERVNVFFCLHGQDFAFGGVVWKSSPLELRSSEALYRSLDRHWPRVPNPAGLRAEILLPNGASPRGYPLSKDYCEVEQPEDASGLDVGSLDRLVDSFRSRVALLSTASRLRMLREEDESLDPAETAAAKLGRVLFVPSTWGDPLPDTDAWGDGRLITQEMAENHEGIASLDGSSPLRRHIATASIEGINSFIVSPVLYYRSVVAFVHVINGPERPRALDPQAVELAWSFSRNLAWFLKRHGYFKGREGPKAEQAQIIDACPSGLQVLLGHEAPLLRPGSHFAMKLHFPKGQLPCKARVTRRVDAAGRCRYGLSLEDLAPSTVDALAKGFYGHDGKLDPRSRA